MEVNSEVQKHLEMQSNLKNDNIEDSKAGETYTIHISRHTVTYNSTVIKMVNYWLLHISKHQNFIAN